MGLYIAGNAIGGLSGRVIAGVLAEHGGWRVAMAGVSGLALACAVAFALLLPRSKLLHAVAAAGPRCCSRRSRGTWPTPGCCGCT